jgi:peroxiredoxin/predicted 2-oxoglutarate/Fe(II)-dependent dioxygenase YbiX
MGGYRAVLFFFGSARDPQIKRVLAEFDAARQALQQTAFFGISIDPNDQALETEIDQSDRFAFLWDFKGDLSIRYGVCQLEEGSSGITYDPTTFILDENLRILSIIPLETHLPHVAQVLDVLSRLPAPAPPRLIQQQAPVLLIPQVFSLDFCQHLIHLYETDGGTESGFMKQEGDKTVVVLNPAVKRRRDLLLTQPDLVSQINGLIGRRVMPEIEKAFYIRMTQAERYTVACYDASNQGFFTAHRDNTAAGTAHRRFAMTINLNTGEYEGGCLRFPEYGTNLYAPEPGGAIVFSCSLLHEATPVTQGRRFALLSFFFDEEGAKLRQQTQKEIVRLDGMQRQALQDDRAKSTSGFQPKKR